MNIKEITNGYKDYVIKLRREFHENPEKSMEEFRTSKRIKEELDKIGVPYVSSGGTGVVATIKGNNPGKTVALRGDMDALQVVECTEVEYKSKNEGLMHACAHDGHTSMLLGAAKVLNDIKDDINGTVKLFFQPGEEVGKGARAMIKDGAMEGVDGVFGIHLWSDVECGTVSVEEGPRMASADFFKITVKGKGGHGSLPHQGVDAVLASSALVMNLQSMVSREVSPLEPLVVSVGILNSGTRFNVIASEAVLEGTIRLFNPELRKQIPTILERIAKSTAEAYRAEAELEYGYLTPAVINDRECSKIATEAVIKLFGKESIALFEKVTGAEDFAEFMNIAPGALAFVGARNEAKGACYPHHHGCFNIDEDALEIGTALYVQYAVDFLNK
ncbi:MULTISPECIES: M20 family metallopeptidase [unclassified Clostridioides]|uniref:M20 family metallopeptidase n=1 Tax=unclassified Clostridioides TaxID=2635829 RepID=UPI001D0CCBBB|nr:amidohydrolase [Clostridioides sp. ES-S-0049-03]MCC0651604.1 amidohydrolase [Clostridioides sp. ES-S-0001-03]MCC0676721.1 amidohydrolase [Clostridioides sp. ES-W-0018-02]MCC0678688.1 amidohydrolase [Clostridioides sp. ES-S-0005-03]MCC0693994.1 amidohydrolase [Clostridioides sp. ES-S-0048-02]MCC0703163.1 amidohydrolase [Clostridioides sp. ES-S-0049-02]MCC0711896.1 amidohydrolase [Clostridioides sp. ES-W-0017-02]MCC0762982.1 amidohydrolase [Clostridioides sp. ES-S-0006-03]UDN48510.1 amidoh